MRVTLYATIPEGLPTKDYRGNASAPLAGGLLAAGGALFVGWAVSAGGPGSVAPLAAAGAAAGPLPAEAEPVSAALLAVAGVAARS